MAVTLDLVKAEEVGLSTSRLSRIDECIANLVREEALSGGVALVARHGQIAHLRAVGSMDREAARPMRQDAIFRIYSMTKPIACAAVLMLFEEGRFLLDDPIAGFIPEFAAARVLRHGASDAADVDELTRPVSIRHLLMHTSGIGYEFSSRQPIADMYKEQEIGSRDLALGEMVPRLARIPLNHQPGEGWTYGFSHDVLGRLVEVVSGQTFDRFLRERIFDPLEMVDTGFDCAAAEPERVAAVYASRAGGGIERSTHPVYDCSTPPRFFSGGGGLLSTATDYARFCQMLLGGGALGDVRILGRKTVDLMRANATGPRTPFPADWADLGAYGFGLGVRVLTDFASSIAGGSVGEYGWAGALSTYFWIDPAEDMYGIFMTQLEPPNFRYGRLVQALAYQALT